MKKKRIVAEMSEAKFEKLNKWRNGISEASGRKIPWPEIIFEGIELMKIKVERNKGIHTGMIDITRVETRQGEKEWENDPQTDHRMPGFDGNKI